MRGVIMAYFDNAATTFPKPEEVYREMDTLYRNAAGSVGRSQHQGSKSMGKIAQETRKLLKALFQAENKEVIFTPTATIALNMVIQGIIAQGVKNIYISPFEHNAVTRILHHYEQKQEINVHIIPVNKESYIYDLEALRYDFERVKPDAVIVSHISNVTGLIAPIEEIFSLARSFAAYTIADLSQSAGLKDIKLDENFDFAVFAGHKTLYGPTGISGFLMKPNIKLPAVLYGGTGYDSANQDMPERIPEKYEMGTMNTAGLGGLHAALKWLHSTGIDTIWQSECQHYQRLKYILASYYFIELIGISPEASYAGIVSCRIRGISSDNAANIFSEQGIAVRSGLQCAPLAHKFLGTYPAGTVRFSVSYFTTEEDFAELAEVLDFIEDNM